MLRGLCDVRTCGAKMVKKHIGREVLRTVREGEQHACARSEAAKGASDGKENKKEGHKDASSRHKARRKMWRLIMMSFEVVSVFSDSDVISGRPSANSLAPYLLLC